MKYDSLWSWKTLQLWVYSDRKITYIKSYRVNVPILKRANRKVKRDNGSLNSLPKFSLLLKIKNNSMSFYAPTFCMWTYWGAALSPIGWDSSLASGNRWCLRSLKPRRRKSGLCICALCFRGERGSFSVFQSPSGWFLPFLERCENNFTSRQFYCLIL